MPKDAAVEEFARLVRALKARDGRSYEALGRRLSVSASTLHRYCSGATVPESFAVVDRLAVLCGADEEERRALEAAWQRADRARRPAAQAAPTPAAASTPTAASAEAVAVDPALAPAPDPGGRDAEPSRGTDADPNAGADPDTDIRPAASGAGSRPAGGHLVGSPARLRPHPVTGTALDDERPVDPDSSPVVPVTRTGADPARPRRRRPLLVVGAVVAVAALGLGLGALLLPSSGPGAGAPAAPPAASGSAAPAAPAPLTVSAASDVWQGGCGGVYLLDRDPQRMPAPPDGFGTAGWARAQGAVPAGETPVRITVQGRSGAAVVLRGLHVRVVERGEPLPWRAYRSSPGCGGALTPRHFAVDLDRPRPLARPVDGYDASGEGRSIPAVAFPYKVTVTEPEELLVSARTAGCDCRWYLELEWSSEGRSGTVRITDEGGRPFRTSGAAGRPTYEYDGESRRWITSEDSGQSG
ncbi:helix-turn-helix domain-containing protein [Streptomyces sp. NPDC059071]|uniref:helix-turn-helix domain-containing protein n=1 Tax=unclassified Streptomyces TaxID=2593676 RepID=UPI003665D4CF